MKVMVVDFCVEVRQGLFKGGGNGRQRRRQRDGVGDGEEISNYTYQWKQAKTNVYNDWSNYEIYKLKRMTPSVSFLSGHLRINESGEEIFV